MFFDYKILNDCCWLNFHYLPVFKLYINILQHDILCFEMRNSIGYGFRFVYENEILIFRGLLEPPSKKILIKKFSERWTFKRMETLIYY